MKIGVMADTHGYLDPKLLKYFQDCDEVWHGGDIGSMQLLEELRAFKPTQAVFGNIDGLDLQGALHEDLYLDREGLQVLMTHIAGKPPRYTKRIHRLIDSQKPKILICGHSHILRIISDRENGITYINPGACGNQGFHSMRTAVRMELAGAKITKLEVLNLGKRGAIKKPANR